MSIIFRNYPEQNYKVLFNQQTGFFARVENKGFQEPFWAKKGPELLDISITNWCDRGCEFCYKNSNQTGNHISLENYERIMEEAQANNVFQVALGGGNPNQHPLFIEILKLSRKYDIIPSYTTNGRGLTQEIIAATKDYCGAVAVSAYAPYEDLANTIKLFSDVQIRPNIHFVLDSDSIEIAIDWLVNGREFLSQINALIFLNYKPIGEYKDNSKLLKNSVHMKPFFDLVDNNIFSFKIGFDSCMVPGIVTFMKNYENISLEPCDAGRFSAYISEDLKVYPCSFMIEHYCGESLLEKSFSDIWNKSELFLDTRSQFTDAKCGTCMHQSKCLNGCPFLEEINLCGNIATKGNS